MNVAVAKCNKKHTLSLLHVNRALGNEHISEGTPVIKKIFQREGLNFKFFIWQIWNVAMININPSSKMSKLYYTASYIIKISVNSQRKLSS